MSYRQLVSPNLNTVGAVGACLAFARQMFGAPGGVLYAWTAWENAKYRHGVGEPLPTDASVLLWYSYKGNQGHVTVWVPGRGIYSSPYARGTSHAVLGSIADVERIYGVKYVGWSEDVNGVRVAEAVAQPAPASSPLAKYVGHVVHLAAAAGTWRAYEVGSTPPRTAKATLNPGKFGGLSYLIEAVDTAPDSVVIRTSMFGPVSLPIAKDNNGDLYPTATIS